MRAREIHLVTLPLVFMALKVLADRAPRLNSFHVMQPREPANESYQGAYREPIRARKLRTKMEANPERDDLLGCAGQQKVQVQRMSARPSATNHSISLVTLRDQIYTLIIISCKLVAIPLSAPIFPDRDFSIDYSDLIT